MHEYPFYIFLKNFTAVRTAYADRLKKLKEMSKSGTTAIPATPATGLFLFFFFFLVPLLTRIRSQITGS